MNDEKALAEALAQAAPNYTPEQHADAARRLASDIRRLDPTTTDMYLDEVRDDSILRECFDADEYMAAGRWPR